VSSTAPEPTIVDSSVIVALLLDAGPLGDWAGETVRGRALHAPQLLPFEVGNVLRRQELAGTVGATGARKAHHALGLLRIELWPPGPIAARTWDLRGAVGYYDASYVALAELLDAPLVTLDARLVRAPGPRCTFVVAPAGT
jgi:predicted nucleic acid-binding protein